MRKPNNFNVFGTNLYIYILVPKTIEIIWVSAAHTASYNFISLTPLFFNKI